MSKIAKVSLIVEDYDRAIDWFTRCLGFELVEDIAMGNKRWVVVAPAGGGAQLVLARAVNAQQSAMIGAQGGGRVWLFYEVDDFATAHAHMLAMGVEFEEEPRHEPYGAVAVFKDLYGNRWDLLAKALPLPPKQPTE
ncbi:VOC family protein [Abyssibius alkaniclasticus]|uniref:VOC family protein n=1 Tax=Abyssibius alkaniclasticus TaxID=2881234 RepID=UPI0023631F57|nr:VOC family protein [Abyssibius alkaniclasticus]UPH71861.1 VOC family protein [Abyssibius alkaniclasticus]